MYGRRLATVASIYVTVAGAAQNASSDTVSKDQHIGVNNGVVNQYNVTVTPKIKEILKARTRHETGTDRGWLRTITPANQSSHPVDACLIPKKDMVVILGNSVGGCSAEHCTIVRDANPNAVNPNLLSLDRKAGVLQVNAVILDSDGKVIASVQKNKTHVNRNTAFEWERPDDHTIDVIDQFNRRVLHIRFEFANTVVVEGYFRSSSGTTMEVADDAVYIGGRQGIKLSRSCSVDAGQAVFSF